MPRHQKSGLGLRPAARSGVGSQRETHTSLTGSTRVGSGPGRLQPIVAGRVQAPLRPPRFSSRRIGPMDTPRSIPFTMS